jgi:hypothetical protein
VRVLGGVFISSGAHLALSMRLKKAGFSRAWGRSTFCSPLSYPLAFLVMSDTAAVQRQDTSSMSDEKADLKHQSLMLSPLPDVAQLNYASEATGQTGDSSLVRRIDLRIIPLMSIVNFGAARLDALGVSMMGFKNNDYWLSLLVFFIGCEYIVIIEDLHHDNILS